MSKVSLIIATYNGGSRVSKTLHSLIKQTLPKEFWDVVVVDNNSTDNTSEVVKTFISENKDINIKLVFEPKQGLSNARNCGIANSKGEYLVFVDDDELLGEELLRTYFDYFDTRPFSVAAGGKILPVYETTKPKWLSFVTERAVASTVDHGKKEKPFPKGSYFIGGNMGIRRSAIELCGEFDPSLGRMGNTLLGGEEKDMYNRLLTLNQEIGYLPGAVIYHIIPPQRLTKEHLITLAFKIGQSEQIRTRNISQKAYKNRLWSELFKWCATFVIGFLHIITFSPAKAKYLFIMRYQITKGLKSKME